MDDDFFGDSTGTVYTNPELERAAAYYAKKKQYDKAALAALYSGFMQQHYNENENAMCSFKEAEQYGSLVADSLIVAIDDYQNSSDQGLTIGHHTKAYYGQRETLYYNIVVKGNL